MLDIKDAIVPAIVAGGVALLGILVVWYFVTKKYAGKDNRAKSDDKIIRKPQDKVIRKEANEAIPEAKKVKVAPVALKPKKQPKAFSLIPLIGAGVCFTGGALIAGWLMVAGFMALMVGIAVLIQSMIQGVKSGNNPTVNDTVTRGNEALPDIQRTRERRVRTSKAPPQQPSLEGIGTVKGVKNVGNKGT